MKRHLKARHRSNGETRGRKPGRYSIPPLRPVMQLLLPTKDGSSATDVVKALEAYSNRKLLDERAVGQLFHRSGLCTQSKTLIVNEAFLEFCKIKNHRPKELVAFYNVGLRPEEVAQALQGVKRRSETGGPAPEETWAQNAGLPFAAITALASGVALPIQLAHHGAQVLSNLASIPVMPVHWENMSWGRYFVTDGAVRSAIEDWMLNNC
jgi:hypothetical protein